MREKIKIFISYAREDENFKDDLDKHFSPMIHNGKVSTWYDRKILPGKNWDDEINKALNEANVIIFLISANFFSSRYIYSHEYKIALERHKKNEALIISIIARECTWEKTSISKFQAALPKDVKSIATIKKEDRDGLYTTIVENILSAAKDFLHKKPQSTSNSPPKPISTPHNANTKESRENRPKKQSNNIMISLPHNKTVKVEEKLFTETMQYFAKKLYTFAIRSKEIINENNVAFKRHWPNPTHEDKLRNLQVFLQQLCREINNVFFENDGTRIHFRCLHTEEGPDKGYYLKLAAAYDNDDYRYAMSKIPSTEGMIYRAAQLKEPLIYSLNSEWHYGPPLADRKFKDYITFVLIDEVFQYNKDEYLLSMGISFENPDRHKNLYYLLSLCRFDNIITDILKTFEKAVDMKILDTILKQETFIIRIL